ncbi:hypothetical protein WAF17_16510 [Bernardetia sp. ABR2-2B]|uniref:hypothetical protein n=1 Tax=Bernardetia sp. ABR2-2B TaxID=3127472 RepID=UPI0030CFFF28
MENIANSKYKIDNFNFYLRTTAGRTMYAIGMVVANAVGYLFFFKMVFTERIASFDQEMATWLPYIIGGVFAIVMASGNYMAIINNDKELAKNMYRLSIILSISTYALMLLNNPPSFWTVNDILTNGKVTGWTIDWHFGKSQLTFLFMTLGVLVLAVMPDYLCKKVSEKIALDYEKDPYMISLNETFKKHQEARIQHDISKATKSYISDEEAAEKETAALLKSLGIKRQPA